MSKTETTNLPASKLVKSQKKTYGPVFYQEHDHQYKITAEVRYDDECGNGHNSFSITAAIYRKAGNNRWMEDSFGCCHDDVAKHFPQLAPLIKWHLCGSDGPMHYISNTVYMTSERDCWGKLKGEPKSYQHIVRFGNFPIRWRGSQKFIQWIKDANVADLEVLPVERVNTAGDNYKFNPKYTLGGYDVKWHECPFDSQAEALEFVEAAKLGIAIESIPDSWGEGKARDLDAARRCAIWPGATDEDLTAPGLEERLLARLPALMAEFKTAVESLGFEY